MKRKLAIIISFILLFIIMSILVSIFGKNEKNVEENPLIVTTLFPEYDFAKQIVGDKMDVKLLMKSGVETHNYEPTAKDMLLITENSEMFICMGTELEPWTEKIIDTLEENNKTIINSAKDIDLIKIEEFEEKHINSFEKEDKDHEDEEIYDEHLWLSMDNSIKMIDNILNGLISIDEENKDYYTQNAQKYKNEIRELKQDYEKMIANSKRKTMAFGGEFAYAYLVDELDLEFVSVYNNCGDGEDPSIARVKYVIDYINKNNIPTVYYEELSEGTIAKMISEETDSKPLVLYSIHNADMENDTYISLMRKNFENLKVGLN